MASKLLASLFAQPLRDRSVRARLARRAPRWCIWSAESPSLRPPPRLRWRCGSRDHTLRGCRVWPLTHGGVGLALRHARPRPYARILGLVDPWQVCDVQLDLAGEEVRVTVAAKPTATLGCPGCGKACPGYDTRQRSWRHLDTCQFKTILVADVPRVNCSEHGSHQVRVPWAEPGSGFTALMEAVVINWLRSLASIKAVAEQLRLSWDEVDGIMCRAVARGLARRKTIEVRHIGVDETSFQRQHEYVTIVIDLETGRVLHVADDRKRSSLDAYFRGLAPEHLATIEAIAMDM